MGGGNVGCVDGGGGIRVSEEGLVVVGYEGD